MTRTAIVVGAGIAGLASAIALRQAGYIVRLIEQAPELAPVGAALSLWPNAIAGLRLLGAAAAIEQGAAPITAMQVTDQRGRIILSHTLPNDGGPPAVLPTRSLVQATLFDALGDVETVMGARVLATQQGGTKATVTLGDGRAIDADLVVMADGIWSMTATALIGNAPRYCGYGGVLALAGTTDNTPTGTSKEMWGRRERLGIFDLAGGDRYWFYIRDQAADATPPTHAEIAARARQYPAPALSAVMATPPDALLPFSVHARPAPKRLGAGRIICVGDAAHAMHPNLGQGGCQGIEDAVALGVVARRVPPDQVLTALETLRLARIRRFVRQSRHGALGAHAPAAVRALWRTMLTGIPANVNRRVIGTMHQLPDYR